MKNKLNVLFATVAIAATLLSVYAFNRPAGKTEFLQVTAVESVVPGGLGRSRMITVSDAGKMDEINLENFFSMVGINFGNIRQNDQVITDKIADLTNAGWELKYVSTGVYGADKSTGIFITRYMFSRTR